MTRHRNGCTAKPDCDSHCVSISRKQTLFFVLATATIASPLYTQTVNNRTGDISPTFGMGHEPDAGTVVHSSNVDSNPVPHEERCFHWKLSEARAATVGVKSLNIPSKARREFEKACDASNKKKLEEAEQHARSAIEKFEDYSAAWVMLGISLKGQDKGQEARDACSHAAAIDAKYLPAYLCAAEVATRNQEWNQLLDAANLALGLKSGGDAYAYYYRATAYLRMNNLVEAWKSAFQAVQLNLYDDEPSLYLLTAEIYERGGDNANAIAQLRQLLKRHTDRQLADTAKQFLAKLESQQPAQ